MRIVGVALKIRRSDHLRLVFDDQKYFRNFNKDSESKVGPLPSLLSNKKTGLFKNENLSTPDGLIEFSKVSLKQAKQLVELMIQEAKSNEVGKLNYINRLDQLSDILCRVIDVAEFIRVAHPSEKWINAAQQTHEIMFEYMNQLNTNVELYKHLRDILNDSNITERLSEEEVQVGEYLKQDFERSGIHMDPTTRDNFVAITQEISKLGSQFGNGIHKLEAYWCEVSRLEFESIKNPNLKKEILKHQGPLSNDAKSVSIPLIGHIPYSILTDCDTESVRRKVWISLHNSPEGQVHTLNEFLKSRALLASMLGYKSFAHYQLEHKMAKNPENVVTFLNNLQTSLRKHGVLDELRNLYKYKEENSTERNASDEVIFKSIRPWDRDYLLSKLHEESHDNEKQLQNINEYFSVGTIISGLSKLFTSIYNIEFVPEATIMGETWDQAQVRKVKVVDLSANKTLGYLYLDFWSPKVLPSHFTIVCSRKINNTENVNDLRHLVQLDESEEFQLPVISLICNFQRSASSFGKFAGLKGKEATLLSLDQVDTIFHEMGHAMHSMIGKTNLHNLSGTRCATDFVELPSVLMESFSNDPRVLCKIGRHHITGELLPESLLKKHQENRVILGDCETYMQLKMAMLDQVLHDDYIVQNLPGSFYDFDSTPVYHDLEKKLSIFADDVSTWHGKFPHLFSYGAVYYSYLLDRAIAEKIWKGLFKDDPWSRQAGEKYKNSILKWGGTRDPWVCLADALDNQELSKGDSKAMEIIGSDALSV
ncbi:mitochondrial intermediate peptidase [Scheffersomyces amazonensis]|uniref:mitochondrial intermediate peptidase n=1 Tax=Scheffersomyces amazonensis TaxID=1078765 RepID=UPI00315D3220